jgi:sterol desaturase/sphingolipid hydroxylase (fatty acid hydroxylase superfamily)
MEFKKIHNSGEARLFQNKYLELLTKTHPLLIWGIYLPIIIFLLYYSTKTINGFQVFLVFLAGAFFWSFIEYLLHRFVFHYKPKTDFGKRINYLTHGNHHEYPRDKNRLFMPPLPSLTIASLFFLVYYLVLGNYAFAFFPGFMFGYLLYGSMHYAIHAWNPPFKWMKPLWRNHHLHHYKHGDQGFGVSSTFWDLVFGTMYETNIKQEEKQHT